MSKLFSKLKGFFASKSLAGVDKVGNRYFARTEEIDGIMWSFCRMIELEARREHVKMNVARKDGSPDLKSFIQQFPGASFGSKGNEKVSDTQDSDNSKDRSSEPTGSGESFKPGTWQPPT